MAAAPLSVYYVDGVDLYEAYTPDFVRDIWLTGFAQGAARAAWLIPLIKAEFAFIEAFLAPVWVVVVVDAVEWLAFYDAHKQQIHTALSNFGSFNDSRLELKSRFPTLYDKALSAALDQLWQNLGKGVQASDIAYFVGRVIGTQGLLGKFEGGKELTLRVLTFLVAEKAFLVTALHSPAIVARAGNAAAAEQLRAKLAEGGINVSEDEAIKIAGELEADSGATDFLEQLKTKAEAFQNSVTDLGALPQP